MPITECPSCRVKIKVKDEMLGCNAKCPKCATPFVVVDISSGPTPLAPTPISERPQTPPPLPKIEKPTPTPISTRRSPKVEIPEDEIDELDEVAPPRSSRSRDDDKEDDARPSRRRHEDDDRGPRRPDQLDERTERRWGGARTGLQIVFISVLVILGCGIVNGIVATLIQLSLFRNGGQPFNAGLGAFGIIAMSMGCIILIAVILLFIGMCMCCGAPYPAARARARVAVGCVAGAIVVGICGMLPLFLFMVGTAAQRARANAFNPMNFDDIASAGVLGIIGFVVILAIFLCSFVFWMLFHASIGERFGNDSLRKHSLIYLGGAFGLFVLSMMFRFLFMMMAASNPGVGFVLGGVSNLVFSMSIYGWYAVICRMTIKTLS